VQDAALACVLLVVCVVVNNPYAVVEATAVKPLGAVAAGTAATWMWWVATAVVMGAMTLRRRWPAAMLAVAVAAAAAHVALAVPPMVIDTGVLVLLYTVAAHRPRVVSLFALGAVAVLVAGWSTYYAVHGRVAPGLPSTVVQVVHRPDSPAIPGQVSTLRRDPSGNAGNTMGVYGLALLAAWSTGSGTRNRRAYQEQLRARARDLERERDQQAELAAAAERGRISREMHDVVAHGLSVIVIQAQDAAAALHDAPGATEAALDAIVTIGRDSLADMRRVLAAVGEADDTWHPAPGLGQLPALIGRIDQAGTPVRLRLHGTPVDLPAAVDLSAYRIVQEALTNTIKHAGAGAAAEVSVTYGRTDVRVEVRDNGHGLPFSSPATSGGGNGLRGMRERTRLLGGSFNAGPGPGGGFVVEALLPIHRPDETPGPHARSALHHALEGHL
jgi:signal transduction histidine kinase